MEDPQVQALAVISATLQGYKFQQLRDQNYEFAICLGISPFSAHCWVLPKAEIMDRWRDLPRIIPFQKWMSYCSLSTSQE